MVTDIKDYVARCIPGQQAKHNAGPTPRSMAPLLVPDGLWKEMTWGLIGPLKESHRYNAITVCVDPYSKEAKFQATMN
jgi:hypothetical protein